MIITFEITHFITIYIYKYIYIAILYHPQKYENYKYISTYVYSNIKSKTKQKTMLLYTPSYSSIVIGLPEAVSLIVKFVLSLIDSYAGNGQKNMY